MSKRKARRARAALDNVIFLSDYRKKKVRSKKKAKEEKKLVLEPWTTLGPDPE